MIARRRDLVLGIDVGTSGLRVAALDRDGGLVQMTAADIPAPERQAGRVTQEARVWRRALHEAMAAMAAALDLARVRAIAVGGTSGTVLAIDAAGAPLGPASLYNDLAPPAIVETIACAGDASSAAQGPSSALGRAIELVRRFPLAARIVHQADWIGAQFSARFDVSDESNALKTGYDPVARAWPSWIEAAGMPRRLLPAVSPVGRAVGRSASRPFGLPDDALVVAGATDGCAAFLATGARAVGDGVTSLGTTLVLKLLCAAPLFAPHHGLYSHRIGDAWLAGGASNSGGGVLAKFFTPERITALESRLRPDRPTGLAYYPLSAPGERFPISDPSFAPRLSPRPPDDAIFLQGLLEGIAAVEKLGYDRIAELGGPLLRSVRSVGGGARNRAWSTIRARILGVPMPPPRQAEAACGAAELARRALIEEDARA